MTDQRQTPLAQSLPATVPFVAPERMEEIRSAAFEARLGANELSFGPSPKALAAMADSLGGIWKYGEPENRDLRQALAGLHGIRPEEITVGEGIDGLLGVLVRLYVKPGDAVVTSAGSYPTFNYHVAGFGGVLHTVPYKTDREDPEALIAKAKEVGAKLVYLSNPNNPMGTVHSAKTVQAMIEAVPEGCLMVLDEAYTEFAPDETRPQLDTSDKRVIRFRTFSKAYGMAGARIGYGIAHREIATGFDKIRNHFGVNRVAQAGALAALRDQDYLTETLSKVAAGRARLAQIAQEAGLTPLPSSANFVTMDCGRDGDYARALVKALDKHGVFVRMPGVAPLDRCIRVSVGLPEEIEIFAERLPLALAELG
ncbi:pyridoxal phosphate-dependent aminotransferase [Celeribacter halophilus]|uniref:Pyridoxal phosphate-dependent aminotransferase n=1 Tax=Celeribacter halophilus TaxID=576117 RepID=A0AAW7XU59_9RHOB|nr:pyridoxal phosphate-dependent aminotransferase [Celeribacter halophilus]MDO6456270.1 pyridoxal phosphate-dependent aminotransferase [Celeribacter halophilus]MDO6722761.1 pyridoxal phosphate-dependent aminotransferase [Celeribacter halophilus]